ncbi:MAG: TIGR03564 family F420-dependent LLM class oxidoreductase [Pseudomonadales bacterium]
MKMGLMLGASDGPDGTIDGLVAAAQAAETSGFDNLWMANIFGLDAISTLAIIGRETRTIGLGTAVTPTYPRHPSAIAQQALTTAAATDGRFTLGIGLSHKVVIEDMLGMSYDKPAKHMKEYLEILTPLLEGEAVTYKGEHYKINNLKLSFPGMKPVPLLVAALGPVMLKIAGGLADGTVTWMTGPNTLADYIIPSINKAASVARRAPARIAAGFPIVVTDDISGAREMIGKVLQIYGMLPSYRAMLDKEGVAGPAELALAGPEKKLKADLQRLKDIGVTDFCGSIVAPDDATYKRTLDFMASV